jgi:hypothetical protein
MAGYSGTPLLQKIGIKPGHRIILRNYPPSFLKDLGPMPDGAEHTEKLTGTANVIVCFTDRKAELQRVLPSLPESWFQTECYGSPGRKKLRECQRI